MNPTKNGDVIKPDCDVTSRLNCCNGVPVMQAAQRSTDNKTLIDNDIRQHVDTIILTEQCIGLQCIAIRHARVNIVAID